MKRRRVKKFTIGSLRLPNANITKVPPQFYTYEEGKPAPIRFNVPRWIKAGVYCYCAGEGDEVFRIDEFKGICAGLSRLNGCDQGWEMLHKLEPCEKTKEQIDVLVAVGLLQRASKLDRLSAKGCCSVLTSVLSVIQSFGEKGPARLKGDPEKLARKILRQ